MALLFLDGFDHYGTGADGKARMLEGVWAELNGEPAAPSFGAATGPGCFQMDYSSGSEINRLVIPGGAKDEIIVSLRVRVTALPQASGQITVAEFRDTANALIGKATIEANGAIALRDAILIDTSASGVIVAGSWINLEFKIVRSTGVFECHKEGVEVVATTSGSFGSNNIEQFVMEAGGSSGPFNATMYVDDLIIKDGSGSLNADYDPGLRVTFLQPNADTSVAGWSRSAREKFGDGILVSSTRDSVISVPDLAAFDIGSGDFTIELWVRFLELPTSSDVIALAGQWATSGDRRSWQLALNGPSASVDPLTFAISTDGTASTVNIVHEVNWEPELDRWYALSVSRASGVSRLYIDGVRIGADVADAATYFTSDARLAFGGETSGSGTSGLSDHGLVGMLDEVRFTVGVGRYTGNSYSLQSAPFPRDVSGDPDFASVQFLAGFDVSLSDESANAAIIDARDGSSSSGAPKREVPNDDSDHGVVETISGGPRDDTFLRAALTDATGTLLFNNTPYDGMRVTLGSKTYRFTETSVTAANQVLIGATIADSVDNLVNAINAGPGAGTAYGTGTVANVSAEATVLTATSLKADALLAGTSGNNIASTAPITSFSTASQDTSITDVTFNDDGSKMYTCGASSNAVYAYDLAVAYDVGSAAYNGEFFDISSQATNSVGMWLSPTGDKMFIMNRNNRTVYAYDLGTNFDVSTAVYNNESFLVNVQDTGPTDVLFNNDGSKMYMTGNNNNSIFAYDLGTNFDVSTAVYNSEVFNFSNEMSNVQGAIFNATGAKMFAVGNVDDSIYEYDLATPFDVSTASYSGNSLDISSYDTVPTGLALNNTGSQISFSGAATSSIYTYTLVTPLDLSTAEDTFGTWTGATLAGGADIPGPVELGLDPLPADATLIRGISLVTRQKKTGAGVVEVQASLVTTGSGVANGSDRAIALGDTYYNDVIEVDPNTSGEFTPTTLTGAKVRLNRTTV